VNRLADPAVAGIVVNVRDITGGAGWRSSCVRRRKWRRSASSPAASAHDFNNLLTGILGYCH